MTPNQLRAARNLLGWRIVDLAEHADVGKSVVADYEAGRREPRRASMAAIIAALEAAGIELLEAGKPSRGRGIGVRLRDK